MERKRGLEVKLLLIEDDDLLCQSLAFQFQKENAACHICKNGLSGYQAFLENNFDIILIDRMLPDIDGIEILKKIKKESINTPVILLTALGSLTDRVTGLYSGADDYITKPFEFNELMARIRVQIRHAKSSSIKYDYGDITYQPSSHTILCGAHSVQLSKREANVFEALLSDAGNTIIREQIIRQAWGEDALIEDGNLDNYIYFLRKRLAAIGSLLMIKTIHGVGYKLCPK